MYSHNYDSIHSIIDHPIPLERIMTSSLVFDNGFGEKRLSLILEKYPDFMKTYKDITVEKIKEIEGFSEKTSTRFVENIPSFIKFMKEMPFLKIKHSIKEEGEFKGKVIVFSGFRDSELKEKIENSGGKVMDTVSNKTTYLIIKKYEDKKTSKIKKAESLNVKILLENKFRQKYNF